MKKKIVALLVSGILVIAIVASIFLSGIKPDTSGISQAQKIAEFTKPATVMIYDYAVVDWTIESDELVNFFQTETFKTTFGGSGSGAIISPNGYIVTNAHVVQNSNSSDEDVATAAFDVLCSDIEAKYKLELNSDDINTLLTYVKYTRVTRGLKVFLPGGLTLDGELKTVGAPVGEGKDVAVVKVEANNLPTVRLGDSENLHLQDDIWVFGYPAAADSSVLSQESMLVATITDGKVSALDKKSAQGSPVLQVSAASTHGNSGGPVIDKSGNVMGLLTFRGDTVNGQEVQGFNFAVPVNTVKEFVDQAGAKNIESKVDTLYKEGMNFYWGGFYKEAISKFEEIQRLFPQHSEVKRLLADCQDKASQSKIYWPNYKVAFIIFNIIAVLAILLLLYIAFLRKPISAGRQNTLSIPDLNNDGVIDVKDFQLLQAMANNTAPAANQTTAATWEKTAQNTNSTVQTPVKSKTDTVNEPPKKGTITIDGVPDINNDGKIDLQDILGVLKQAEKKDTDQSM